MTEMTEFTPSERVEEVTRADPYAAFATRPWDDPAWDPPAEALAVPTMLTEEEGRLLHWLGASWAEGAGAICDLGCFAGGSTARLAAGTAANPGKTGPIHAFDFFTISPEHKQKFLYDNGVPRFWGSNLLPCARRLLTPWEDRVDLHKTDIADEHWQGGPIEILFVDAMKTPATGDAILRSFFPALIPGRSVIVHQDYQHWRQPWIPAQMQMLAHALRPIAWCARNTVVFGVDHLPPQVELASAAMAEISDQRMTLLLQRAVKAAPKGHARRVLAQMILALEDRPDCRIPRLYDRSGFTPERIRATIRQALHGDLSIGETP
ncbi:MAG: class I SAM-dependent methyltransferase [Pseudomonadota bacterium]